MKKLLATRIAVPLFAAGIAAALAGTFAASAQSKTVQAAKAAQQLALAAVTALSEDDEKMYIDETNHVKITWGNMEFAYDAKQVWNTERHQWEANAEEATWTPMAEGGNSITFEIIEEEPEAGEETEEEETAKAETEETETEIHIELQFQTEDTTLKGTFANTNAGSATFGAVNAETDEKQTTFETALLLSGGDPKRYTKETLEQNGGKQTVGTITVNITSADATSADATSANATSADVE